jgi:hypothetical protein
MNVIFVLECSMLVTLIIDDISLVVTVVGPTPFTNNILSG